MHPRAIRTTATCHPKAMVSGGTSNPARAVPAGTPVCLIENISAMRSRGVVFASTWLEAGVIGP